MASDQVCCSLLQHVDLCCSVLQIAANFDFEYDFLDYGVGSGELQSVAVFRSVLQYVAVY